MPFHLFLQQIFIEFHNVPRSDSSSFWKYFQGRRAGPWPLQANIPVGEEGNKTSKYLIGPESVVSAKRRNEAEEGGRK